MRRDVRLVWWRYKPGCVGFHFLGAIRHWVVFAIGIAWNTGFVGYIKTLPDYAVPPNPYQSSTQTGTKPTTGHI